MHRVTHYRRTDEGIEAISLESDRAFPRHAHDEFGVGVIVSGAHRSWSGRGQVDASLPGKRDRAFAERGADLLEVGEIEWTPVAIAGIARNSILAE
ncbi:AraC family ligand binding domain-containing protein, partial [Burkholderia sp. Ap-955]|uniref:AraC family ligand binding domain-containing protein n=1 Tax=Burkholderia sp. Ap-955 TaxID=2608332 RepID=UPI0031F51EE7